MAGAAVTMATAPRSRERHPLSTGSSARGAQPKITTVRLEANPTAQRHAHPDAQPNTGTAVRVHRAGASTPSPTTRPAPSSPSRRGGALRSPSLSLSLHPSLSLGHRLLWSERPALSGLGWRCLPAPTWPGAMAAPQRSGSAALLPSANGAGGHRRENRASWERTGAVPGAAGRGQAAAGAAPVPVPAVPVPAVPWARWMTASGEDVRRGGGE